MCYPACPPDVISVLPSSHLSPLPHSALLWVPADSKVSRLPLCHLTVCPRLLSLLVDFLLLSQQLLLPLQSVPLTLVLAGLLAAWAIAGVCLWCVPALIIPLHVVWSRILRVWRLQCYYLLRVCSLMTLKLDQTLIWIGGLQQKLIVAFFKRVYSFTWVHCAKLSSTEFWFSSCTLSTWGVRKKNLLVRNYYVPYTGLWNTSTHCQCE